MLQLRFLESSAVVAPETGAALIGWSWDGMPVLRRPSPAAVVAGDVHGFGCFPMVPYANRIRDGRFTWAGREYRIARNAGDHPHPMHGVGWQSPWRVEHVGDASIIMTLHHEPIGDRALLWPFAFDANVSYALLGEQLHVSMTIANRHDGPAPVGMGLHPFLPCHAGSTLRFNARGVWLNDANALAEQHAAVPDGWRHDKPRAVGGLPLDHCFTGWDGVAEIGGMLGVTIAADEAFRNLQVYTPPGKDFFCVEAVSHAPDAINHLEAPAEQAMRVLQPGAFMLGTMTITVRGPYEHLTPHVRQ